MTGNTTAETFAYSDRTSIVRATRLPVPDLLLARLGWQPGQMLAGRATPQGFELRAAANGKLKLSTNGIVCRAQERFGLAPGDVAAFELIGDTLIVSGVDGRAHESYRQPQCDGDGVPIPPSWLAQAFTLKANSVSYLAGGAAASDMVIALAADGSLRLNAASRVLDFGCGAGRVARSIRRGTGADIVGYDLYTAAIDWCREHMPYGRWEYGRQMPPIDEPDASFDLIFAVSVLTHLDRHHQNLWLAEWQRLLKPGGLLIPTFKSERFLEKFVAPCAPDYAAAVSRGLAQDGYAHITDQGWAGVFPDYYNDAYFTVDYVTAHWACSFDIVGLHPPGTLTGSRQDVAVLRKR